MGVLVITTQSYPFGIGESFLHNEMPYLCDAFDKVIIVPEHVVFGMREIPQNAEVREVNFHEHFPLKMLTFKYGWHVLKQLFFCWYKDKGPDAHGRYALKKWRVRWHELLNEFYRGCQIVNQIPELHNSSAIVYGYWMIDFPRYLSWMKQFGLITNKIVCRVHGFDFNPNRHPINHFTFRKAELKGYEQVVSVSEFGKKLMLHLFPELKNKIILHRLGVQSHRESQKVNRQTKKWRFVSCSNLVPEKRVDWIYEAMVSISKKESHLQFDWHHFGGGELLEQFSNFNFLPSNLKVNFHGSVDNKKVIEFYENNSIDGFIHVSETEGGCPVAIQEAFNFGIPFIGIANEGVIEMVSSSNSISVLGTNRDDSKKLLSCLENFIYTEEKDLNLMKKCAKDTWQTFFNAEVNYPKFIESVLLEKSL